MIDTLLLAIGPLIDIQFVYMYINVWGIYVHTVSISHIGTHRITICRWTLS